MTQGERLRMMLFRAAVVEVVAIAVTFVSAAGGHGNYVAAKILFPYSLALTRFTHVITRPLVTVAIAQYPAYALVFLGVGPGRQSRIRWIVLVVVHGAAVLVAFQLADSTFTL